MAELLVEQVEEEELRPRARVDLIGILVAMYLFWWFATPYNSAKLEFLFAMRFERILAGTLIVVALFQGNFFSLMRIPAPLVYLLFIGMCISFMLSDYQDMGTSKIWSEYYWKKIVFFSLVAAAATSLQRLRFMFLSVTAIILFYELYSWIDFVRGGSYVYQQGMKRMIGTWSEGGYGAANGFAALALFAMPFAIYMYKSSYEKYMKYIGAAAYGIAFLSVVFSGTRGAMLVAAMYGAYLFRRIIFKPVYLAIAMVVMAIGIINLPEEIKHRYWDLMLNMIGESEERTDQVAISSAEGRIQGFIDGFRLAEMRPVTGFGPGSSAFARQKYFPMEGKPDDFTAQLHNLYGQIAAELGFVGLFFCAGLFLTCLSVSFRTARNAPDPHVRLMSETILSAFLVFAAYGMVGHTLYDVRWLVLFAFLTSLQTLRFDSDQ